MALQELAQWLELFTQQEELEEQNFSHLIFLLHFLNRHRMCLLTANISMILMEVLFTAFKVHRFDQ